MEMPSLLLTIQQFSDSTINYSFHSPPSAPLHEIMSNSPQIKLALVIGSGDARVFAALGAAQRLRRAGLTPDLVIATSSGAIAALAVALGLDRALEQPLLRKLWAALVSAGPNLRAWRELLFPGKRQAHVGLRNDGPFRKRLAATVGDLTFGQARTPLLVTASDAWTGEQVVIRHGRIADAVRATIAAPFLFKPWQVNGRLLFDGAMSDPLPINVAMSEGADVIVAVGFAKPFEPRIASPAGYVRQLNTIMSNGLLSARFAFHNYAHHNEVILLQPDLPEMQTVSEAGLADIIAVGAVAIDWQLDYLSQLMNKRPAATHSNGVPT